MAMVHFEELHRSESCVFDNRRKLALPLAAYVDYTRRQRHIALCERTAPPEVLRP